MFGSALVVEGPPRFVLPLSPRASQSTIEPNLNNNSGLCRMCACEPSLGDFCILAGFKV